MNTGKLEVKWGYFAIAVILIIIASVIIMLLLQAIRFCLSKEKKKTVVSLKLLLFLILIVGMGIVNIKALKKLNSVKEQSYLVNTVQSNKIQMQNDTVNYSFVNYGKRTTAVELLSPMDNVYSGSLQYEITDESGNVIERKEVSEINDVVTHLRTIKLYFNDQILKQNEKYTLKLHFQLDQPINLYGVVKDEESAVMGENWNADISVRQYYTFAYYGLYLGFLIVINVVFLGGLILIWKMGMSDKVFLYLAVSTGVFCCLILPPASQNDEYRHFLRAYEITRGEMLHVNSYPQSEMYGNIGVFKGMYQIINVPSDVNELRLLSQYSNDNNRTYAAETNNTLSFDRLISLRHEDPGANVWVSVNGTCTLTILSYLPQVIFMWIGRLFGAGGIALCYLARFGNLAAAVGFGYLALRLAPKHKNLIWGLYFMPAMVQLRSSSSSDGWMYTMLILLIAYVLYIKEHKKPILHWKPLLIITSIITVVAAIKIPYALAIYALLLLGNESLPRIKKSWLRIVCLFVLSSLILMAGAVCSLTLNRVTNSRADELYDETRVESYSDPEMVLGMFSKPHVEYAASHVSDIVKLCDTHFKTLIGNLENSNAGLFFVSYLQLIIVAILLSRRHVEYWKIIGTLACSYVIGMIIMFVGFQIAAVEALMVAGISERYLLPILPLTLCGLSFGTEKTEHAVKFVLPPIIAAIMYASCIGWMLGYWFV